MKTDVRTEGLPPGAVLGGLLELEGGAGQGVPGQRPGGRRVHGARRHGVAGGGRGEEGSGARACLKEEVPGERRGERERGGEILH